MSVVKSLARIPNWDRPAVRHVLSRTLFGYNLEDIDFALNLSMDEFIDNYLLADASPPDSPGDWVLQPPKNTTGQENRANLKELTYWWYELMRAQGFSLREKMTLFWHNHFTSDFSTVKFPQLLYMQNALFRANAFGNLIDLTKAVTIDSAMLIYLDGQTSTARKPNENYARELMELFTMGIGNYTETDIAEAARALTGWQIKGRFPIFEASRFDSGEKTFLGEVGAFNHEDIVDIIFRQDATAEWFCKKLYIGFVYHEPDAGFISELAQLLRESQYELKPVLSALLKSEYFHAEEIRGAKIKSPTDLLISPLRQLSQADPVYLKIRNLSIPLQQELFQPPDVRGWVGQRNWMSTTTYPRRNQFTDVLIDNKVYTKEKIDIVAIAKAYSGSENPSQFISEVVEVMINFQLSESRINFLLQALLDGSAEYDWSTDDPQAESRLRGFFKTLMRLPEYQLS